MTLPPTSSDRSDSDTSPASGLRDPAKKEIAMRLVSAAENSSINWKCQYRYIEYNVEKNDEENRGYTAGIVGFTSKTGDMLEVVKHFDTLSGNNLLKKYIPALEELAKLDLKSQHRLGEEFVEVWQKSDDEEHRKAFREAQDFVRDEKYFNPAVKQAQEDELQTLGQFIYYDAWVMHGEDEALSIRKIATDKKKTPAEGGDETEYLHAFLDARRKAMLMEEGHKDNTDRVDSMQRIFLLLGNLELNLPLPFRVNKETFY